jgi:tRNA U34 2-thiouridine synthase MnmA/TrmU
LNKKAIALLSGGLDSTLAVKLMLEQGIEIAALKFKSPFCSCDGKDRDGCKSHAIKVAEDFEIEMKVVHKGLEYLEVVRRPKFGYGSGMNPCVDCRIFSFRMAKDLMPTVGASFIVTGEVLGQRPMSQRRDPMFLIEKEAGLEGLIVRPLSAKLLPITVPEKMGIIDREKLLGISGRSRKEQIKIAKEFEVEDYPCSSGGCLLTDENFARRLKDYFNHSERNIWSEMKLLQIGRHFRISSDLKVIVGRNEDDNRKLMAFKGQGDTIFQPDGFSGPVALAKGELTEEDRELIGSIVLRYGKVKEDEAPSVSYQNGTSSGRFIVEEPISEFLLDEMRI